MPPLFALERSTRIRSKTRVQPTKKSPSRFIALRAVADMREAHYLGGLKMTTFDRAVPVYRTGFGILESSAPKCLVGSSNDQSSPYHAGHLGRTAASRRPMGRTPNRRKEILPNIGHLKLGRPTVPGSTGMSGSAVPAVLSPNEQSLSVLGKGFEIP
jgi:hypothetical protein